MKYTKWFRPNGWSYMFFSMLGGYISARMELGISWMIIYTSAVVGVGILISNIVYFMQRKLYI